MSDGGCHGCTERTLYQAAVATGDEPTLHACPMSNNEIVSELRADVASIKATVDGLPEAIERLRETVTDMKVDAAKLPCGENQKHLDDLEKRTRRLEWVAGLLFGAIGICYYLLERATAMVALMRTK